MRSRTLICLVAAGLLCGLVTAGELAAQRPLPAAPAGPLWVSDSPLEDGRRLLIVVDQATRHAAVYHVDPQSGGLTLKTARDISSDLLLDEFNAQEPKPAALRKLLEQAR
ncbi:MAG: hypothetical protein ACKOOF_12165 [Planctomycetaceae bacterium]|jgi:hypothetical protein